MPKQLMPVSGFHPFGDGRVRFEYPDGYSIVTASEHGQFYYAFHLGNRRVPAAALQILTQEHQAEPYRTMFRTFKPLDGPVVRQVVHRHGPIESEHFHGFELRESGTRVEDGALLADGWSVFMDFGNVWAYFNTHRARKPLDEAVWSRVVYGIRIGA